MTSDAPAQTARTAPAALRAILADIRVEQTLFSLPFLALSAVVAAGGAPAPRVVFWTVVALVAARCAAMATNRAADASIDARNPRTAGRAVPAGKASRRGMALFAAVSALVLVVAAARLNPLCAWLSPVALLFLIGYSWTKRFTWLCHAVLGTTLGIAPLGAWAAVRGRFGPGEWFPWLLAAAVALWVGGFDMLYASPDAERDRAEGLHSVPGRFGVRAAFGVAAACHVLCALTFALAGRAGGLGPAYWAALAVGCAVLAVEHVLVRPGRYDRMATAFFRLNALFSVLLATAGVVDVLRTAS